MRIALREPGGASAELVTPPALPADEARPAAPAGVRSLPLLAGGLLLAFAAQVLFNAGRAEGPTWQNFLLSFGNEARVAWGEAFLTGALVMWFFSLRAARPVARSAPAVGWPRYWTFALVPVAACAAFAAVRFDRSGEDGVVRGAWIVSLVGFLAAAAADGWRSRREPAARTAPRRDGRVLAALALILAGAAYLRFTDLGSLPDDFHGDMSTYGHIAREFLSGSDVSVFGVAWGAIPRVGYLPTALALHLAGDDVRGLMTAAAVGGMLALLALYALCRVLFGSELLALAATAVSAGNVVHVHFSRIAAYMDPWPFCLGALWLLADGLKTRRRVSFAVGGVLLGFGLEMYHSGRVTALVCAAFLVWALVVRRDLVRGTVAGWALFAAGVVLAVGPNFAFFARNFYKLNERGREVFVLDPDVVTHLSNYYQVSGPVRIILRQIERCLLTFHYTTDTSTQFGWRHGMLSLWIAPFATLGLVVAVRRWREPGPALALVIFALTISLGGFLTVDAPFWPRLVGIVAAVSVFSALAFETLGEAVRSRAPALGGAFVALVAALLVVAAVTEWNEYRREDSWNARPHAYIGRFLETLPLATTACAPAGPFDMDQRELTFLAWPRATLAVPGGPAGPAVPRACAQVPFSWILAPDDGAALARLEGRWPEGVARRHDARNGDVVFRSFTVLPVPRAAAGR